MQQAPSGPCGMRRASVAILIELLEIVLTQEESAGEHVSHVASSEAPTSSSGFIEDEQEDFDGEGL